MLSLPALLVHFPSMEHFLPPSNLQLLRAAQQCLSAAQFMRWSLSCASNPHAGDSLSCDLPMYGMAFGQHAGNRNKEEEEASNYAVRHECEPPTAYIAYLRQGCADKVHNHVYYALGLTDTMRCGAGRGEGFLASGYSR